MLWHQQSNAHTLSTRFVPADHQTHEGASGSMASYNR
jgi:hypothetical protein